MNKYEPTRAELRIFKMFPPPELPKLFFLLRENLPKVIRESQNLPAIKDRKFATALGIKTLVLAYFVSLLSYYLFIVFESGLILYNLRGINFFLTNLVLLTGISLCIKAFKYDSYKKSFLCKCTFVLNNDSMHNKVLLNYILSASKNKSKKQMLDFVLFGTSLAKLPCSLSEKYFDVIVSYWNYFGLHQNAFKNKVTNSDLKNLFRLWDSLIGSLPLIEVKYKEIKSNLLS